MQREQTRASRNVKSSDGNLYTKVACKKQGHMDARFLLLHHQIHALADICHPPYTVAIKFMSVFFVSRWHFPFSVFARLILSICPSKMFFYPKHLKSLYTLIDLCYAVLLVTFMHWCDLFFSVSITLHYLFAAKLSINPCQVNNV